MTICKILEGILPKESVRGAPAPDKKLLEYHFVFACIWAFGGCMLVDKVGGKGRLGFGGNERGLRMPHARPLFRICRDGGHWR